MILGIIIIFFIIDLYLIGVISNELNYIEEIDLNNTLSIKEESFDFFVTKNHKENENVDLINLDDYHFIYFLKYI